MAEAAKLYQSIGGAKGCFALATAFYAHVAKDPILRPFFPSTFTCAIEEFSAFLVQFLGGEAVATQRRWWLSLRESHNRFAIGPRVRAAWLKAMNATLEDRTLIADDRVRFELMEFFRHSSAHVVNRGETGTVEGLPNELDPLWQEQLALDEVVALARLPDTAEKCIKLAQSGTLLSRFERSPAVHASFLALAARSKSDLLREYAVGQIRGTPSLVQQRYQGGRSLLQDASAAGDLLLMEQLLNMGAGDQADAERALYCVGNQCNTATASEAIRLLIKRSIADVNAKHGSKYCTALHMAARRGNVDVIGALLDAGAEIEVRDSAGDTPLRRAVNCNHLNATKQLLARGADAASVGSKRLTPALAARRAPMKQLFATR
ncbi:MAG: ankyrin repeat domain-containing protein [Acidobacteriota bacterium]